MTFKNDLDNFIELVNSGIASIIKVDEAEKTIVDAMNYSLLAGGKRVRPTLLLAITKALGGDINKALPFAISIECIHTYSLIHDDLPAMDDDDLRRGIPTNHIKFGEANAILAGDGLLNLAYEIMFDAIEKSKDYSFIKIGSVISKASGIKGMISGQIIDMESEEKEISIDRLINMHRKKTGALIEASCVSSAIVSNREDILDDIREYGQNVGLVFQIVDDILDYTGDSELLGKSTGSDKDNNKSTFVTLLGIEESKALAEKLTSKAIEFSDKIDKSGFLSEYTRYLLNRNK